MTINERVDTIITELYNGNKRAFSIFIGVSPTVIENVVGTRQGKPSYDVLEKICAKANISGDWLLTGEGSMLKGEKTQETPSVTDYNAILKVHLDRIEKQREEITLLKLELEHFRSTDAATATP